MYLSELKLGSFRNISKADLKLSPGVNIFVGENAQGKTNLLEAVSLLAHTKSFRRSKTDELISWGSENFFVSSAVVSEVGDIELEVRGSGQRKQFYVNGEKVSKAEEYLGKLITISFTPEDVSLVKGAPAFRRRFIDHILGSTDKYYLKSLAAYNKVIKHKNKVLQTGGRGLEQWNELLVEHGSEVNKKRKQFIDNVSPSFGKLLEKISDSREQGSLAYHQSVNLDDIDDYKSEEIRRGVSLYGPHREDIEITLDNNEARPWASQGQARSCALSLVMAASFEVKQTLGKSPILLLDDVESELDKKRQDLLYSLVQELESQVFVTATDTSRVTPGLLQNGTLFKVEKGYITPDFHLNQSRVDL